MKIIKYLWKKQNDFYALFECEKCNARFKASGYDDSFFHSEVVPNVVCPNCDISSNGETKEKQIERRKTPVFLFHMEEVKR